MTVGMIGQVSSMAGDVKKRIDWLRREIRKHDYLYYVLNQPEISDQKYDELFTELKKLEDLRSPLAFLLGKTKLENELRGLSKVVDQAPAGVGNTLLRGVPQSMAERVSEVELEITPSDQIVRILMTEADGATTEFRFADLKENLSLGDGRFEITPPPGVETVEGELGP